MAKFQKQNKAVSLEEQTAASIQQAAELKGYIIAKEVEIAVMKKTMKPQNPLVIRVKQELEELKTRYKDLQYGLPTDEDFYVPFDSVPEVGLRLAVLTRELKVQQTVWELLNEQYYQAKIQEARDTPTVQVLDPALPPVYPSSPKRVLMVVVFGVLSIVFSTLYAFGREYFRKLNEKPEEKQTIDSILQEFRKDFELVRSRVTRSHSETPS